MASRREGAASQPRQQRHYFKDRSSSSSSSRSVGPKQPAARSVEETGRLKMQDWKMSDESAGLEFDGLAMRVRVRKTVK